MAAKIKPLKKYGQNFLRNESIAARIVDQLACRDDDTVLEIGAGEGVLTERLIKCGCARVIAVELDPRLAAHLRDRFGDRVTVVEQNFLTVPLARAANENKLKIIGNIPYYLTSDILFRLIGQAMHLSQAVLMVQKEVAERLTAAAGNKQYGLLTVFVRSQATASLQFIVGRENFYPVPGVDSAVVRLDFTDAILKKIDDYELFREIVRCSFATRRKMLRNSLGAMLARLGKTAIHTVDLENRPEALSIDQFVLLANELAEKAKN